jgi:hypothetical protein
MFDPKIFSRKIFFFFCGGVGEKWDGRGDGWKDGDNGWNS